MENIRKYRRRLCVRTLVQYLYLNACYEYNINKIVSHHMLYLHFVLLAYQNTVSGNEMCVFQDLQMFGLKLNKYMYE